MEADEKKGDTPGFHPRSYTVFPQSYTRYSTDLPGRFQHPSLAMPWAYTVFPRIYTKVSWTYTAFPRAFTGLAWHRYIWDI